MATNITMPALSPTMEEGTLAKWLVKEGDEISAGDVIAEIETDKATMEVEAVDEGILGKIVVAEGTENVPVNDVIAVRVEEGEDAGDIDAAPEADLAHVRLLAAQRGVPVEQVDDLPYSCGGLIHPRFTRGATGADGLGAATGAGR